MKTTPLPEILKQITPLPWVKSGARIRRNYRGEAGQEVAWVGMDGPSTEPGPNAAYITHAANVLPGLVEALEQIANKMGAMMRDYDLPEDCNGIICGQLDQVNEALSLATNVPVNS